MPLICGILYVVTFRCSREIPARLSAPGREAGSRLIASSSVAFAVTLCRQHETRPLHYHAAPSESRLEISQSQRQEAVLGLRLLGPSVYYSLSDRLTNELH